MFTSEHEFWKTACAAGQLDDWLPYAEELIRKWASQESDEVEFSSTWEVLIAISALKDDLLPASARVAISELMNKVIDEARTKNIRLDCLHIAPAKPGRKSDRIQVFWRFNEVKELLRQGSTTAEAYEIVARKYFKSPDTIRREFERSKKKNQKNANGKIDS